jgi:FkbM family methyltransferase
MKKIFIDVGGYEGDASLAALDPLFGFDKVYCFEPVRRCAEFIAHRIPDSRFELCNVALADVDGKARIFGPGSVAGSLFADHDHVDPSTVESCDVVRATTVLEPLLAGGARVWLKLNCEGAEIPIVEDLLASGLFARLESVLLDLDARKIPSLAGRLRHVLELLDRIDRRNWFYPEEVQYGQQSTFGGIRNWLRVSRSGEGGFAARVASIRYNIRLWRTKQFRGYYKFVIVRHLPKSLMRFYYASIRPKIVRAQTP